jgi:hypothetical protein
MKSQLTIALACLALALTVPVSAADAPTAAKAPAVKKSMSKNGSFHTIHAKKAKTECDDCHSNGELPADTVMLRLHDKLAKGDPGPVNHETCYDCHSRPSKPLPFFAKK